MSNNKAGRQQSGMTLIELIVAIVIIGVSVGGVLSVFISAVRGSADPLITKQAFAIAEALLEEVELAPFTYCDPADPNAETATSVAGCSIPLQAGVRPFDHIDKYHAPLLAPVTDIGGAAPVGLGAYTAAIAVTTPAAPWNGIPAAEVRLITVTVAAPNGVYTLDGFRTRYAPNAVP